jgi:hypothetical protein
MRQNRQPLYGFEIQEAFFHQMSAVTLNLKILILNSLSRFLNFKCRFRADLQACVNQPKCAILFSARIRIYEIRTGFPAAERRNYQKIIHDRDPLFRGENFLTKVKHVQIACNLSFRFRAHL